MTRTLHNPNKVLLGTVGMSDSETSNEVGDPNVFKAGLAVRLDTSGMLSLDSGSLLGVSLGKSISDKDKTSVVRIGQKVPIRLTDEGGYAYVVDGKPVLVDPTTGMAASAGQMTSAIYCHSGSKIGVYPGFTEEVPVAQIDMIGGL